MNQNNQQTNEALCAAIQSGDESAKGTLIEQNLPFIHKLARQCFDQYGAIRLTSEDFVDDLIQTGSLAMLTAAERYDAQSGVPFLAYAKTVIINAMRNALTQERADSDIHLMDMGVAKAVLSLDSYDPETDSVIYQCVPDVSALSPEEYVERKEDHLALWKALKALNPHDREFIMLRFGLRAEGNGSPMSVREAAEVAQINVSRARRMERNALAFLKRHIEEFRTPHIPEEVSAPNPQIKAAAERIIEHLRQNVEQSPIHVARIPIIIRTSTCPETISATADLTVVREETKTSAYAPTWIISTCNAEALDVRLRLPNREGSILAGRLRFSIEEIGEDACEVDIASAPDLAEWLWFLMNDLWCTDSETRCKSSVQRCLQHRFVRDVCELIATTIGV